MKLQEKVRAKIQPKGIYNVKYIEDKLGFRTYKLYEFAKGKARLSDEECRLILKFIKESTK